MLNQGFQLQFLINKRNVVLFSFVIWFAFIVFSLINGYDILSGLNLFADGQYSFISFSVDVLLYLCGNITIFIIPGLSLAYIRMRGDIDFFEYVLYAFVTSNVLIICVITIYKVFIPSGLTEQSFFLILVALSGIGICSLVLFKNSKQRFFIIQRSRVLFVFFLLITAIVCFWFNYEKISSVSYDKNFSQQHVASIPFGMQDDLMEHYGITASLKNHLLPYWDLEYANKFGYSIVDPPMQKFTSLFLVLLFGSSFAIHGLFFFIILALTYYVAYKVAISGLKNRFNFAFLLLFNILFLSHIVVVMSDFKFAVPLSDTTGFICFFTMVQMYFLIKEKYIWFLSFALLAFLTKYESILFTLSGILFYGIAYNVAYKDLRRLLKKYLFCTLPYLIFMLGIGSINGYLDTYVQAFLMERLMRLDYLGILGKFYPEAASSWYSSAFSWGRTVTFLKQYVLASSFLGLFLFFRFKKDKISLLFQGIALVYFVLILLSKTKRIHYVCPLVLFSIIVAVRFLSQCLSEKGNRSYEH